MANVKAPILLLQGPPGTGKTSIAKSLAKALGRKFHRISLGGVRDEAEIRGHRRTYVGAMPGLIVQALKKVGCCDPVILLDEIDKMSSNSHHGDPSAAMLEVLDPEQNHAFNDHYVNIPVDLSKVLFIATANSLDTIPPPLLDRMETISLPGYTFLEKKSIAERHLIPKQAQTNGLTPDQAIILEDVILKIATEYTREAGVRNLEREIGAVCRYKAVEYADSRDANTPYDPNVLVGDLQKILGIQKFEAELAETDAKPGVVTGLAYMGSGNGGLLFFEAVEMPGKGQLQLTGNLGEVIKESAHIALSWVRANAYKLGMTNKSDQDIMQGKSVHVHAPAGSIPKDGPSAGVALTLALVSLLSKRTIPPHIAMTGEVTLRGQVLPVGGIKEKVLGAHRAGIKTIILPFRNRKDAQQDLPDNVKQDIHFVFVKHMSEVLAEVWGDSADSLTLLPSQL